VWTGHITEASKPVEVSVVLPTGDEGVDPIPWRVRARHAATTSDSTERAVGRGSGVAGRPANTVGATKPPALCVLCGVLLPMGSLGTCRRAWPAVAPTEANRTLEVGVSTPLGSTFARPLRLAAELQLFRSDAPLLHHGVGTSCSWTSNGQCRPRAGTDPRKCRKSQVRMSAFRASAIAITMASPRSSPDVSYRSRSWRARRCSASVGRSRTCVPSSSACEKTSAPLGCPRARRTR
jgi:hypothetical protein